MTYRAKLGGSGDFDLVGVDVAHTAGDFAADSDGAAVAVHGAVDDHDVLRGHVDSPAVGVAPGFDGDVVVVGAEVAVADDDVVAGFGVAAVGVGVGGARVGADAVDGDVGGQRGGICQNIGFLSVMPWISTVSHEYGSMNVDRMLWPEPGTTRCWGGTPSATRPSR